MTTTDDPDLEWKATFVNEHLVGLAMELIGAVHDGGPNAVRDVLARVPYDAHDALCVVLAAACDPGRTPKQLLGWVDEPLAIASRDRTPVEGRREVRTRRREQAA